MNDTFAIDTRLAYILPPVAVDEMTSPGWST